LEINNFLNRDRRSSFSSKIAFMLGGSTSMSFVGQTRSNDKRYHLS
jgi:hypothetical protein